jgi:signal transduction histidine kinase/CheY-like chemotaxis protein
VTADNKTVESAKDKNVSSAIMFRAMGECRETFVVRRNKKQRENALEKTVMPTNVDNRPDVAVAEIKWAEELGIADRKLALQILEKDARADELLLANREKDKRANELVLANREKDKRADELLLANKEKDKRAENLITANKELEFQSIEKDKRADELFLANREKDKRAEELILANKEKDKRADELLLANKEKDKRADELLLANKEKDKRAENLISANKELEFQNMEKGKRADELFLANVEKDRRAEELTLANKEKDQREIELVLANKEKDKRADELFLANVEKDRRAEELTLANRNLVLRTGQLVKAQKMEAIGRLTAGIAHDFNNLLAIIHWNVELAELCDPSSAETVEHLAIKQAINSGSAMTQRLVASSTNTALASLPTDIADIIRNKISVYKLLLGEKIDFEFNAKPALWPALVNENRFDDAIYNLIANAKDAMPHGGKLSVTAENVILNEDKAESIGEISAGMYVLVTVDDDGCGIEPELLHTVFDPFYTSKQFGESNGLGLSMVYGFARQTGGHVLIESEPRVSTKVKLYLPRATALAKFAPEPEPEAVMPNQYAGRRILVVEDNPEILSACQRGLEIQGFHVVTALNGRDAIARLSEDLPFDLLFSDIVLPGDMSGIDVQREAHLLQPTIKSILTTGYADVEGVGNISGVKDTDILRKPYSRKNLLDRIEAALAS